MIVGASEINKSISFDYGSPFVIERRNLHFRALEHVVNVMGTLGFARSGLLRERITVISNLVREFFNGGFS